MKVTPAVVFSCLFVFGLASMSSRPALSQQDTDDVKKVAPQEEKPPRSRRFVRCAFTLPTQTAVTVLVVPPTTQVAFASLVVPVFAKPHALPVAPASIDAVPPWSTPWRAYPVATAIDSGTAWWQSAPGEQQDLISTMRDGEF